MKTRMVAVARIDLIPQGGGKYQRVGWVRHPDNQDLVSVGLGPVGSPFPTEPGVDGLLVRVPQDLGRLPIYRWSKVPAEVTEPTETETDPDAEPVGPQALGAPEQTASFNHA